MTKLPPVSGVLLLDKPPGISSNGALGRARRLFGAAKAGHTGTLDPFATGLLPIAFGEASKFSRFLLEASKGYVALVKLGASTSTGDTEGSITCQCTIDVSENLIDTVLSKLSGPQQQIPPMHSALKRDGVPLYKLARQGIEVERAPREIILHRLKRVSWDGVDELRIEVLCSKGTYIRVLAEDIGKALGTVAHLTELRRTSVGTFSLEQAVTLESLETLTFEHRISQLKGVDSLAAALPSIAVESIQAEALLCGKWVLWRDLLPGETRAYGPQGEFLGIVAQGEKDGKCFICPVRMMSDQGLSS